jgi:hypothetical protein
MASRLNPNKRERPAYNTSFKQSRRNAETRLKSFINVSGTLTGS